MDVPDLPVPDLPRKVIPEGFAGPLARLVSHGGIGQVRRRAEAGRCGRVAEMIEDLPADRRALDDCDDFHRPTALRNDYFGTRVADPYRWMEDLSSPELKQWVDAENALAFRYLDALPQRNVLKARITELWNYPKVTPPQYEGGHWFYSRNTGLQRQSVVFMCETLNGPEAVALDPNSLSPDGSIALSGFVPAPDGRHFAYGQSQGGSDWSTYYVRDLVTGRELPDVIRWVRSLSVAWTEDGKGLFYGRYPEPRPGKALEDVVRDKKIYYHTLGTPPSADLLIYERPEEPMLFIDVDIDETARYVFFETQRSISKNELIVKDLVNPLAPTLEGGSSRSFAPHCRLQGTRIWERTAWPVLALSRYRAYIGSIVPASL